MKIIQIETAWVKGDDGKEGTVLLALTEEGRLYKEVDFGVWEEIDTFQITGFRPKEKPQNFKQGSSPKKSDFKK